MMASPYSTLGVARTADAAEIKRAYRRLTQVFHPDKNSGDKSAEERFKEIGAAYAILGDAAKRAAYDEFGELSLSPGFDANRARTTRPAAPRGADLGVDVDLPLLVALRGGPYQTLVDRSPQPMTRITLTIPAGCPLGQTLRLPGLGRPGLAPGDLVVRIRDLLPDPRWRREGRDLVGSLPVTLGAVYAGSSVLVEDAPWGPLSVAVPARSLEPIRVAGHGWRDRAGSGDLVLLPLLRWPRPDPMLEALLRAARY